MRLPPLCAALALVSLAAPRVAAAQETADSVTVSGQVTWAHDTIERYPERVVIRSRYDPGVVRAVPVDSTGAYEAALPVGSYRVRPAGVAHFDRGWGQEFVRIDEATSYVDLEASDPRVEAPPLVLDTLEHRPDIPEDGLYDSFGPREIERLDAFIGESMAHYAIPGVSLAVFKDGGVAYEQSYGVENPITGEPVDETTLFEAGSITKLVFAFAMMRLAERGLLDLDRPLYLNLPFEDVAHDDRYKLITARHVLSHQTGLPNWFSERDEEGRFDLLFTPGTGTEYSGEGFEYLKRVVTHVLGKDLQTIYEEEVIGPLGLDGFHFGATPTVRRLATDALRHGRPVPVMDVEEPMAAYSMMTNANHFADFALALRNRVGLAPETYDEMLTEQAAIDEGSSWGLGIFLSSDSLGPYYEHLGVTADFVSAFRYYPEADVGFAAFANSLTGGWLVVDQLERFLAGDPGS